jgi:carboxymethylenebutenolidase
LAHSIVESRVIAPAGTPALVCLPNARGSFSSVVLLHERYGMVRHTEDFARRIAAEGYVVVAPDLFSTHPDQAGLRAGAIAAKPADEEVLALLEDAVAVIDTVPSADSERLGMIGVCQTGRYPLLWAAHHPLRACVVLYGAAIERDWVVSARQPWGMEGLIEKINTSVLALFGEKDHIISLENVLRLRAALEHNDVDYEIAVYPDAPHGWLNETMPGRYRPELASLAWREIAAFLHSRLREDRDASLVRWSFRAQKHSDYEFANNVRYD